MAEKYDTTVEIQRIAGNLLAMEVRSCIRSWEIMKAMAEMPPSKGVGDTVKINRPVPF